MKKLNKLEIISIIIILIISLTFFYTIFKEKTTEEDIYCTADAKLCPDGTYVSRVAPDCNFESCPVSKVCEVNEDCVVFGQDGDCNCGCFNKDALPQDSGGDCFCAAPTSCECVDGTCEGIFE